VRAPVSGARGDAGLGTPPPNLRHPWEPAIFMGTVVMNIFLFVAALGLITYGSVYLETHPRLKKYASSFETLGTAALLGLLSLPVVRNLRYANAAGNAIRLSVEQIPEFHSVLQQHCARVGIPVPELLFSDRAKEPAHGYTSWNRRFVILGTQLIDTNPSHGLNAVSFLLGREVGRFHLKQAEWWDELVLSYTSHIPVLRAPLRRVRAYSRDRYGAWLAPNGLNALVMLAAGRRHAPTIDLDVYLRQVHEPRTLLDSMSELASEEPHISNRIRALVDAGLLERQPQAGAVSSLR